MKKVLVSWIGGNDLDAIGSKAKGPILATLEQEEFDQVQLIYNYPKKKVEPYLGLLESGTSAELIATSAKLRSPVDFNDIYLSANKILAEVSTGSNEVSVLISPGTPAMQSIWILLGKTKYTTRFLQSSIESGVEEVTIPFDISAEFLPGVRERNASYLMKGTEKAVPIDAAFDDILSQNPDMQSIKARATEFANWDIPVLIQGETGTGKELFATAIHNSSLRKAEPFVPVNCGAFPPELIDSTLFGHIKGAFTGATSNHKGLFEQADGGTIFLDEFGELMPDTQVRLLRVLEDGVITPIGSTSSKKVDVRVVAATNRNLIDEVASGHFREDLFYRVAVGVLNLPPLREREGDIGLLATELLKDINTASASNGPNKQKYFSVLANNLIVQHHWPGNVREMYTTLFRAYVLSQTPEISADDVKAALFEVPSTSTNLKDRKLEKGFEIQSVIDELVGHYIDRALTQANGNKTKAAELLGLKSYQTLKNWMEKHNVK